MNKKEAIEAIRDLIDNGGIPGESWPQKRRAEHALAMLTELMDEVDELREDLSRQTGYCIDFSTRVQQLERELRLALSSSESNHLEKVRVTKELDEIKRIYDKLYAFVFEDPYPSFY